MNSYDIFTGNIFSEKQHGSALNMQEKKITQQWEIAKVKSNFSGNGIYAVASITMSSPQKRHCPLRGENECAAWSHLSVQYFSQMSWITVFGNYPIPVGFFFCFGCFHSNVTNAARCLKTTAQTLVYITGSFNVFNISWVSSQVTTPSAEVRKMTDLSASHSRLKKVGNLLFSGCLMMLLYC